MQLLVSLRDFNVQKIEERFYIDFDVEKGKSEPRRASGHIYVNVLMTNTFTEIAMLHPDSANIETGQIDLIVEYKNGEFPIFIHGGCKISLSYGTEGTFWWPTGSYSLLKVMLALEEYLEKEMGLDPTFRKKLLAMYPS